jgi:8-oxo-dGTP pyrophosphatase MutT (NUDIX family)
MTRDTRHDTRSHHLQQLLTSFEPADAREHAHRARTLQLLATTAEPFSRTQYAPGHITASAFVLDPTGTSVLLILHSKLQRWLQPGGHVDPEDRDVLHAARREVLEEVGVSQLTQIGDLLDLDVHDIPARKDQGAHAHFDLRFLFKAGDLAFQAGSDANDARWVPIAHLLAGHDAEFPSDESVLRAVRKLSGVRT